MQICEVQVCLEWQNHFFFDKTLQFPGKLLFSWLNIFSPYFEQGWAFDETQNYIWTMDRFNELLNDLSFIVSNLILRMLSFTLALVVVSLFFLSILKKLILDELFINLQFFLIQTFLLIAIFLNYQSVEVYVNCNFYIIYWLKFFIVWFHKTMWNF